MKQFFLILLVCVAGYFLAPDLLGIKPTSAQKFENAGAYVETNRPLYTRVLSKGDKHVCQTTLTFALDLGEAEAVSEDVNLVSIDGCAKEIGLMLTKQRLTGRRGGKPWVVEKGIPLAELMDNPNVERVKGRDCLVLSVIVNGCKSLEKTTPGITVVDASGSVLLAYPLLNPANNELFKSISFNEELVTHVMIAPKLLSVKAAGKRAVRLKEIISLKPGNALLGYGGCGVAILLLTALWPKPRRRKADDSALKLQSLSRH